MLPATTTNKRKINMRKIIVTEFITLDGVTEAPHEWSFTFWNDEISKFKHDELLASDALLLGRVTYQGFAAAWPSRTDESGYADRINAIPQKSLFDLTKGVLLANCIFVAKQGADHENPQSIISDFAHDFHVRTESLPAV